MSKRWAVYRGYEIERKGSGDDWVVLRNGETQHATINDKDAKAAMAWVDGEREKAFARSAAAAARKT